MSVHPVLASHYKTLIGVISPWKITDIKVSENELRIDVFLAWPRGKRVVCPECGKKRSIYDYRDERLWRHLDISQFQTFLHCSVPRANCPIHGALTIPLTWAQPNSRWTIMFERFALLVLERVPTNSKAAEILHTSWDVIATLKKRAVERGLKRRSLTGIEHLGIDEKSFGKHEAFITVLNDLDDGRVLEVFPKKTKEAAIRALECIPEKERESIHAVAMDMSQAYVSAIREKLPKADIVFDKFHIEQKLNEAVNKTRHRVHNDLLKQGDTTFSNTRWLWLKRPERWSEKQKELYRRVEAEFAEGKLQQTKIGRCWVIKEAFRHFWTYAYKGSASKYFRRWYYWATHSRLNFMIKAAKTLNNHIDGILAYFDHGITNALSEGYNSVIQEIKSAAKGFRNFDNYRIAILFSCGKLDFYP